MANGHQSRLVSARTTRSVLVAHAALSCASSAGGTATVVLRKCAPVPVSSMPGVAWVG